MAEPARRPDRVSGRAVSPRAFRAFGIEAVLLGPASVQHGLVRREGVAVWWRLAEHAPVFDRAAAAGAGPDGLLPVRVVVATTRARDRALRVPAMGERAARVEAAAADGPPAAGWLLLVDEGPGETWLYLAEEPDPVAALDGFLDRRGRTNFALARWRSRVGGLASAGLLLGLALVIYAPVAGLGPPGQLLGAAAIAGAVLALVAARPRLR